MAITSLGLLTLAQEYRGDIVQQINRRVTLLRLLRIMPGEGQNVAWAPEGDGAHAEEYAEGADASVFGQDAQASAILEWGLMRTNIGVTNLTLDAAATVRTPAGNRNRWAREVRNGSAKLADLIEKKMFTGTGVGKVVAGLDVAIGSATNTYATIDRSVGANAYWRPTVVDPGSLTAVSFALIRDDLRKIFEASGENPDLAVCSPAVFNAIGGLFDSNKQFVYDVNTARGTVNLRGGVGAYDIDGTLFVRAKDATANMIYYLNTNYVHVEYLPPADVPQAAYDMVSADDGFGQLMLGMKYERLAKTGAAEKAEVLSTIQLKVDRPNACGVRKNVAA